MAVRSLRVAGAYRDFCRAVKTTFAADPQIQRQLRAETARALRQQASLKSEDAWVADLKSGTDMIRYEVIQASLNPETQNYRAHITQEHLSKTSVVDLLPPDEALKKQGFDSSEVSIGKRGPVLGRQAKAQFLKEVYDVTFSGRENVWKVVEKEKRDAKPEKVPDWMRERRRAEERAEKKWSKKFQEWQMSFEAAQDAPEEIQRMPSYREVEKLDSSAKGREEVQKAQREAQELRRECTRLEAELSRLYEEFRRVRREGMEESKRREKLEQHLETVAKDHEAWRERSEHRESQLQQARLLRRSVASRVALFGYELHDLSLRAAGTLSQAAADKGEEPPEDEVEEEADALLDAAAVNEEIARFLEQEPMPDDLIEEPVPADGPRDEEASPAVSPQHGEDSREGQVEEPVPADGPRDEEPDSPGHDWHPDSEEDSPAVSPQHGEDSREWQVEEPVPADAWRGFKRRAG
ncbi:unnamed protein product [Effrenium voratum]|uniref:Uncharacterized protein n=1 Tax=Effrenium voratum TaxID=2562239 RepID=A0AA36JNV3_9DINO|nr:unnamed protein product [Effrenium voratum]